MSDTDLTYAEISNLVQTYAGSIPYAHGASLVQAILNLQADKQNPAPDAVYDRLFEKDKLEAHDFLISLSRNESIISDFAKANKKIQAIQELRTLAKCGLKEAKDAIESAYPDLKSNL